MFLCIVLFIRASMALLVFSNPNTTATALAEYSFETVPVPYRDQYLSQTLYDAYLLTPDVLLSNFFNVTDAGRLPSNLTKAQFQEKVGFRPVVLLCDVSSTGFTVDISCPLLFAQYADALISSPDPRYQYDPGRNILEVNLKFATAPVREMAMEDYDQMLGVLKQNGYMITNATLSPQGTNVWLSMYDSAFWIFIQVFFSILSMICVIFGCWNFYFSQWKVNFPNISHICLLIEITSNLFKFFWWAIDPLSSRRLILNPAVSGILETIPFAICMIGSLLVSLFWFQLLQENKIPTTEMERRLRNPIIGTSVVLVVVMLINIVLPLITDSPQILLFAGVTTGVYVLVAIGIFIFYLYTGYKIIKFLKVQLDHNNANSNQSVDLGVVRCTKLEQQRLRRITRIVACSAVCMFGLVATSLTFVFPTVGYKYPYYMVVWILDVLFLLFLSFFQIMSFMPKKIRKTGETVLSRVTLSRTASTSVNIAQ